MSEEMPEVTIDLKYSDGSSGTVTESQFIEQLEQAVDIVECHISIEESRKRQDYEMAKKFCSLKMDFRTAVAWANAATPETKVDAKKALRKAIHRAIMREEQLLVNDVLHMLYKDGLPAYPRDPHNVFCQEPYDLRKALELQGKANPRIGARAGRTIR